MKIYGWQSTLCGRRKTLFEPLPPGVPFIQILHANNSHWIVVSNIGVNCKVAIDSVHVYDSLCYPLDLKTRIEICSFVKTDAEKIHFDLMNCCCQPNLNDCGVYAIACATELALGKDPLLCSWAEQNMRSHLKMCLEMKKMVRFPTTRTRRVRFGTRFRKSVVEEVFCICRLPNDKCKPMIQCGNCRKWYHNSCVSVPEKVCKSLDWKCNKCKVYEEEVKRQNFGNDIVAIITS